MFKRRHLKRALKALNLSVGLGPYLHFELLGIVFQAARDERPY